MKILIYSIIILMLGNCSNNNRQDKKGTAKKPVIHQTINALECEEKEQKNPDAEDPIIIKTCKWGMFKFVSIGEPDYKGRYAYRYESFKQENKQYIKVENGFIFNNKVNELERLINKKIAKELKELRKDQDNKECLSAIDNPEFSINELGISFDHKNNMVFNISLGLGGACFVVDEISVAFPLTEIQVYLK